MTVLVILSMLLCAVACGLVSFYLLQERQYKAQRSKIKDRFIYADVPSRLQQGTATKTPVPGVRLWQRVQIFERAREKRNRARLLHVCEIELPRMLDILAMGMHAGLSFDAALGLYVQRFDNELANLCKERLEVWERGLVSRSEGLEQLAQQIELPLFDRFCRTASRSIQHGIPMAPLIKEYAQQARKEYRNKQKELVLKAPVKMLLPTGGLILPAMMMLVIGPIILDVTERMV